MYTGMGDPFLTLRKKRLDFGTSDKTGTMLKWKITNGSSNEQLVLLNPSFAPSSPLRVVKDGNIAYQLGAADLSGNVNINTVAEALAYLAANPTEVLSVRITSNNADQFSRAFKLIKRVFGKPPVETIINFKQSAFQTKDIIFVTEEFQLDANTELSVIISPRVAEGTDTVTTFEFNYGASFSIADALENKKEEALQDPTVRQLKAAQNPSS